MRFFNRLRPSYTVATPPHQTSESFDDKENAISPVGDMKGVLDGEGRDAGMASGSGGSESDKDANLPNPEVQEGVKKVEAVTLTWTRRELWIAYGLFVCFSLLPYPIITSSAQSSPSLQGLAYDCLATRRRKQANKF